MKTETIKIIGVAANILTVAAALVTSWVNSKSMNEMIKNEVAKALTKAK